MADPAKDTIYIDIDDEITAIIDKLHGSKAKVVAMVLPKRASVFQSIVNMKLLKRAADSGKKNLVLITTEAGLLPLAGAAGVHVAKTLTSKPEIPLGPQGLDDAEEAVQEDASGSTDDEPVDPSQPVGKLAGGAAAGAAAAEGMETVELDNEELSPEEAAAAGEPKSKDFTPPKKPKNKKLKVPNFARFRLWLILGVVILILLIIAFIVANASLNRATINIKTNATAVNTNLNLNLDSTVQEVDSSNDTVPAKIASQQKTYSQQVPTTGQTNKGNIASGSVNMTAVECSTSPPADVPAGSGLSANGQTYITQADTSFIISGNPKNGCFPYTGTSSTSISAQSGGTSYNTPGSSTFTVAGRSDVSASGSASGGTDNIVQTVNQNDINNAKSKIGTTNDSVLKQALENQLQQEGYDAIAATYSDGTPTVTQSANVGTVANTVTVTETIVSTMFGAKKSDLQSLVDSQIDSQIDTSKQSILDDGVDKAVFNLTNLTSTTAQLTMSTQAVAGPQLNVTSIKKTAAGNRSGDVQTALTNNPNVVSVSVKFSPFWVSSVPKNLNHITVNIAKPTTTSGSN